MNKKKLIKIFLVVLVAFLALIYWGTHDSFYRFKDGEEVISYLSKKYNQEFQYIERSTVTANNSPIYGEAVEYWGTEDDKMSVQIFVDTGDLYDVLIMNISNDELRSIAAKNAGINVDKFDPIGLHQTNDGYYYNISKGDYHYMLEFTDDDNLNKSYFLMTRDKK